MVIRLSVKRAYEPPAKEDGLRILVDRVWPRGISRENLKLYRWEKELAPSTELRKWFAHDPAKWFEFKRRYFEELQKSEPLVVKLRDLTRKHVVTLLYGAKSKEYNQAVALREFLLGQLF